MIVYLMTLSLFCSQDGHAQQVQVSVAPYYGGRLAALSLSFDDGLQDHYTMARPELNKRGLRATFAIVGSKVGGTMHSSQDQQMGISGTPCMTWAMLRQLAVEGHEIASHGWEHRNVTKLTPEELHREVQRNDSAIMANVGCRPRSYFYPGNRHTPSTVAYCEAGRTGSRTFQTSLGSKRDTLWLRQWVDSLVSHRQWGVTMTHGIATGYDHFHDPQVLWAFLDMVAAMQDSLWVAPLDEVTAYVKECRHTTLSVELSGHQITVIPSCPLPESIFSQPLTLQVSGCRVKKASQGGRRLKVYRHLDNQYIDFMPHEGPILIRWKYSK